MYLKAISIVDAALFDSPSEMLKVLLFLVLIVCVLPLVSSLGGLILGPGQWMVNNVLLCDDPDQYDMTFTVSRRKLNRTHDCFSMISDLRREINVTHSILIDVYKKVDGGFKFYQVYASDCACEYIMKFAEENTKRALTMGGFDPPDCPLPPRHFEIKDFVMDYTELPKNGVYGTFQVNVYLVYETVKLGCVQITLTFEERSENEDEQDDDD